MRGILNQFFLLMLMFFSLVSCDNKKNRQEVVCFVLEPFDIERDTVLRVKLINNTNNNYFITLSNSRTYGFSFFNYEINNSVIARPVIYENSDNILFPKLEGGVYKMNGISNGKEEWLKNENLTAELFLKDYKSLKNAVFLKENSISYLELPFKLKYPHTYDLVNHYVFEKDKRYTMQLIYKMSKSITEKLVKKRSIDSVKVLGYLPYYDQIVSNEVSLFTK